uniref:Ubiquitin thioesterase OTU n=1 Tax=Aegilops tauschii TaxID=37682 RepID=R7WBP5_AEGTA
MAWNIQKRILCAGYCQRIRRPDFWGGESELLVLSRLCRQPIIIYIPEREYRGRGNGFIPIAEYGLEFTKDSKEGKKRVPSWAFGEFVDLELEELALT